jgi:hypothetical protein
MEKKTEPSGRIWQKRSINFHDLFRIYTQRSLTCLAHIASHSIEFTREIRKAWHSPMYSFLLFSWRL